MHKTISTKTISTRTMCILVIALLVAPSAFVFAAEPIPLIFDTDMGNDIDDALALGVIHGLQNRGECRLIAVTSTKDHDESAPFIDVINTFYGRGDIPIGVVKNGVTRQPSKYTVLANQRDNGKLRYPHDLLHGRQAENAVKVIRRALVAERDRTVVIVQVGFSTNLARLLASKPDSISRLSGKDLIQRKVRLLSVMAGAFAKVKGKVHHEYNVIKDIPSAQAVVNHWPTAIVFSGFEVGLAVRYPSASIRRDFNYVRHHPLAEGYKLYSPPPHNRPSWDLTSVLYVVRPKMNYFGLSPPGKVTIDKKGVTSFQQTKTGKHRFLTLSKKQRVRVTKALVQLSSQPPKKKK